MRCVVTLYCEQTASVVVDAPRDATRDQLQELALRGLDESGGAEWETQSGFVQNYVYETFEDEVNEEGRRVVARFGGWVG